MQLPEELLQLLQSWPRRLYTPYICDMTPEKLNKEHNAVLSAAGLPHVTLHGLRHSFATLAVTEGIPVKLLQVALGHSTYKLTADLYADHLQTISDVQRLVYQRVEAL